MSKSFRVELKDLSIRKNVVVGCNFLTIASLVQMMKGTTEDPKPAIIRRKKNGGWEILDGRHRYTSAIIAGRNDLLCIEEKKKK